MTIDSVSEFVTKTHANGQPAMPTVGIGAASAKAIIERIDMDGDDVRALAEAVRGYLPAVNAEIAILKCALERNPGLMARRAFLFAIATPKRDEQTSIHWALAASSFYGTLSPLDMAAVQYVNPETGNTCSLGMQETIARGIEDAYAIYPDGLTLDRISPLELLDIHGIGPKVSRMATAASDPTAAVWTVDLWHARQALWLAGLEYRVLPNVSPAGYPILEAFWLDFAQQYFPHQDMWAVQWACWNAADGHHNSHMALWADLALTPEEE